MDCERYKRLFGKNVAVIGASEDRGRFSNKAVRTLISCGYKVFPVNPKGGVIEGINIYESFSDIKEDIDFVSVYLSADKMVNSDIFRLLKEKKVKGCVLNPGTQEEILIRRFEEIDMKVLLECTIRSLGRDPDSI